MKTATIIGPYVLQNFGDDLIGAVIAKQLSSKGYKVNLPGVSKANCEWLHINYNTSRRCAVRESDLIVIGGGGMFGDAGVYPTERYRILALKAAMYGKLTGKRIVTTGVGAGPLSRKKSVLLTLALGVLSEKIGVRDKESYSFLAKIGINSNKLIEGADIALLAPDYFMFPDAKTSRYGFQFDADYFPDIRNNSNLAAIKDDIMNFINLDRHNALLVSNSHAYSQLYQKQLLNTETLCYQGFLPPVL